MIAAEKAGQAQGQAEENLRAARRENARAEKNLQVAVEAFEQIIQNIASRGVPESLAVVPGEEISVVTPADAELLEMLLAFFDQFAKHNEVDFTAESAAALKRVGDIHQQLGRLDEAEEAYRQALAAYERLDTQDDTARSMLCNGPASSTPWPTLTRDEAISRKPSEPTAWPAICLSVRGRSRPQNLASNWPGH